MKLSNAALSAIVVVLWIGVTAAIISGGVRIGDTGFRASAAILPGALEALTNGDRASAGVPVLADNPLLDEAAQMKANDMLQNQYYAHISPSGRSPFYWLDAVGYKYLNVGENLDLVYSGTEATVNADWMNSTEHRTNILLPQFTETGIGSASGTYEGNNVTFVVELFATPMPAASAHATNTVAVPAPEATPLSAAPVSVAAGAATTTALPAPAPLAIAAPDAARSKVCSHHALT